MQKESTIYLASKNHGKANMVIVEEEYESNDEFALITSHSNNVDHKHWFFDSRESRRFPCHEDQNVKFNVYSSHQVIVSLGDGPSHVLKGWKMLGS